MTLEPLPKRPFSFILYFLRPYLLECLGMLVIGILWSIDLSLRPYIAKIMLDKLEAAPLQANLFTELMWPAITYIGLGFGISGSACSMRSSPAIWASTTQETYCEMTPSCVCMAPLVAIPYRSYRRSAPGSVSEISTLGDRTAWLQPSASKSSMLGGLTLSSSEGSQINR